MNKEKLLKVILEMTNEATETEAEKVAFLKAGNGNHFVVNPNDIDTIWDIFKYIPNISDEKPDIVNKEIIDKNYESFLSNQSMNMYHNAVAYGLWLKIYLNRDVFVHFKDGMLVK